MTAIEGFRLATRAASVYDAKTRYPALNERFANGELKREDTVDQYRVMLKLSAARAPYGISNALTLDWYRRENPAHGLADWQLEIARHNCHCSMPRNAKFAPEKVLAALERLKNSGRITSILKRYQ